MWLVSISVMLAVVQWASSDGGSPRLPTRRMPPFFWASALSAAPATSASDARTSNAVPREGFSDMRHLQIVGEPIYHTGSGSLRPERQPGGRLATRAGRRRRLLVRAPVGPRRASEPSMERARERARILVPQEKRDFRNGQPPVAQERRRHFTAEIRQQRRERRPLLAKPALERTVAHPQRPGQTRQGRHAFGQRGPQRPAYPHAQSALVPDAREYLLGEAVEVSGELGVGQGVRPSEVLVPEQECRAERAELERCVEEFAVLPHVDRQPIGQLDDQRSDRGRRDLSARREDCRESIIHGGPERTELGLQV